VRHESFVGVGQSQTFSKIKTQHTAAQLNSAVQNKTRISQAQSGLTEKLQLDALKKKGSEHKAGFARFGVHFAILTAVASFVVAGKYTPTFAQLGGDGAAVSAVDQTSELTTGAAVANATNSVIKADVAEIANTASSQVYLATAGDGFLAKKQPMQAAVQTREVSTYTVKNGDTLWSISSQFNITTDTIKWANDLDDNSVLRPGANLTILPVNGVLYTARGGESLSALATRYQANATLIDSFNDLQGATPAEGQKLIIPDGVVPQVASAGAPSAPTATRAAAATPAPAFSYRGNGNGYTPGQCTWYVASRRAVPGNWGNAISWYYNAQASGFAVGAAPRAGAIGWERNNHVVYVESVNPDGSVNVSEMNFNYRAGVLHRRTTSAGQFLYIY
jgi:surface antigen